MSETEEKTHFNIGKGANIACTNPMRREISLAFASIFREDIRLTFFQENNTFEWDFLRQTYGG